MPTTIDSAGITFNDATSLTSATIPANAVGATQIANGSVTAAKLGTTEQKQIAKAWVNFNGDLVEYTSGNTVSYVANSPSAGQTTVTVNRTSSWTPLPVVGDWITVSGVTGATAVNGTFQITQVDNSQNAWLIRYIVPSVVTGTVAGTAVVRSTAIRSSYNVSSITKTGNGYYTVNFATAMANANYVVVGSATPWVDTNRGAIVDLDPTDGTFTPLTTTSAKIRTVAVDTGPAPDSVPLITVAIFGN
jgi:hypothetical protein